MGVVMLRRKLGKVVEHGMLDSLSLDERGMLLWSRLELQEYVLLDKGCDNIYSFQYSFCNSFTVYSPSHVALH
jgi:hypothetical protein